MQLSPTVDGWLHRACSQPGLSIGLANIRYFNMRRYVAAIRRSADGAALAAVQEVDVRAFLDTGQILLLPSAYGQA